ncbi:hypothetical protein Aph01nite_21910 [Acrocarpospora phusangensis]|uniref:F5/8 type C domain-containing protein n=1 Tax=Acrocarpospora phusangensis TaxID=1070424 RepID=A0A919UJI6_9ACTN|nr:DUF1996 domain-containing protein [Acrocarpospora phusangensis]GIH23881.1 hypothetical protein Aph01nite_21910 [Acrocarpospora phusangensis]
MTMSFRARVPGRTRLRLATLLAAVTALLATSLFATAEQASAAVLSQGRPTLASSVENGGTPAGAAVDGNAGTRWSSAFSVPQWIRVDLGSAQAINQIVLNWEAAYATAFTIQTSPDGNTWTTIHTVTNGTGGNQTYNVNGNGRYVRLHATAKATAYGVSLWEFQVHGPGSGGGGGGGPIIRVAEFLADCPFSHRLPDDPIVAPNLPGGSHMHSFFGSTVTNAFTTLADLQNAPTNCNPSTDLSSYWVPTLYVNNVPVEPTGTTFYYLGEGVRDDVIARTQPIPLGLRIVAGNAKATAPDASSTARWSCLHAGHVPPGKDFVTCPAGTMLESYLDFPQCWNGTALDSPDHKSHMAYPVNGDCPSTHPVPVPKLRQVLRYPVNGSPATFRLASGPGYTMHGDFFNAWPVAEMERRVRDCIRPIIKCGANGTP